MAAPFNLGGPINSDYVWQINHFLILPFPFALLLPFFLEGITAPLLLLFANQNPP